MKYYPNTQFEIKTGNKSKPIKTVCAITSETFDLIIADCIRECGIAEGDYSATNYLGFDGLDRYIEIETGWGNSVTVYVRNPVTTSQLMDATARPVAEDGAELYPVELKLEVSWSSTSRTISAALEAIHNYEKAIHLACAIESRMQLFNYYYIPAHPAEA